MQRYPQHGVDNSLTTSVSILAIGSEILDGRVRDTNSQFIASELSKFGITLQRVLVCDDDLSEIHSSITFLASISKFIIISGGLGPTSDDLTREGVAAWSNTVLEQRQDSIHRLEALYAKRQRVLDPSNYQQACFPHGSTVIPNHIGTAEGFQLQYGETIIFSVPGVPKELMPMFFDSILPVIQKLTNAKPIYRRTFRIFGLPESNVGSIIKSLHLSKELFVSYRASFPEIHIVIKGKDTSLVDAAIAQAKEAVGQEFIFIEDAEKSLSEVVGELLIQTNKKISVAESCTGGMLGSFLTKMPGISKSFLGGFICYSNDRKIDDLNVSTLTLSSFGAVSEQCAKEMAKGAKEKTKSDIAISITGIAGPDGGSDEKPVGTFYIGVATNDSNTAEKCFILSDRNAIRLFAAYKALDTIRRIIT